MIDRISQSFIKEMRRYLAGSGCGIPVKVKYIDVVLLDDASASMKLGQYFEYVLTGQRTKGGNIPQPEFMASAIKKNGGKTDGLGIPDMYEPYRAVHENAVKVKQYWKDMGFEIVHTGKMFVKGRFQGDIDVVMKATKHVKFDSGFELKPGDLFVLDIKYSGLLDDRWSEHGWDFANNPKALEYHGTQAKQYSYITGLPFFFWVTHPKSGDIGFFRMMMSEKQIQDHITEGNYLYSQLKLNADLSFEPRPSFNNCKECPLKDSCEFKHAFPHPVDIKL